jgi:hypothetical protein
VYFFWRGLSLGLGKPQFPGKNAHKSSYKSQILCQIYNKSWSSATISPTLPSMKLHVYNFSDSRVVTWERDGWKGRVTLIRALQRSETAVTGNPTTIIRRNNGCPLRISFIKFRILCSSLNAGLFYLLAYLRIFGSLNIYLIKSQ